MYNNHENKNSRIISLLTIHRKIKRNKFYTIIHKTKTVLRLRDTNTKLVKVSLKTVMILLLCDEKVLLGGACRRMRRGAAEEMLLGLPQRLRMAKHISSRETTVPCTRSRDALLHNPRHIKDVVIKVN